MYGSCLRPRLASHEDKVRGLYPGEWGIWDCERNEWRVNRHGYAIAFDRQDEAIDFLEEEEESRLYAEDAEWRSRRDDAREGFDE